MAYMLELAVDKEEMHGDRSLVEQMQSVCV
jgi:hypothetical protein